MASGERDGVADDEADRGADEADENALGDEDAPNLFSLGAERHQDGNVFGLLHDHHSERDEDVESGDEDDQPDSNESDEAFETESAEERLVLLHPVGGHKAVALGNTIGSLLELLCDFSCAIDVVEFELEDGDDVAESEELLGVGEADEGPGGIVVVEAGVEDSCDAEANVFGDHAEGSEFSLGRGDEDDGADRRSDFVSHVVTEDNGRHGGLALLDGGEVVGGRG